MRNALRLLLPLVAVAAASAGAAGCSSTADDAATSEAAQTEEELAVAALRVLGAKVQGEERNEATCHQCHDPNRLTIRKWAEDYKKTMEIVSDESKTAEERINAMRRDPSDPGSSFAPAKLGIMTAGSHLGLGANVSPDRHPITHKQGKLLASLFEGREEAYRQFRQDTLMPIETNYDRLTPSEFETVMRWIDSGLPKLEELLPEDPRPTTCTDDFAGLAEHVRAVRSTSWASANRDARMPMFGCAANADPLECFGQKTADGKTIFPTSNEVTYGKSWAKNGDTFRVLRELDYKTFFWTRTSADGRFVANGGGPRTDGARAVISDLAAALDPEGPKVRDILASASYDPDFFPGNQGFMFQGTSKAGAFCSMSLLTNPATTKVSFDEPECTKLDSVGLYQTVGQVSGDNSISDIFVVNSKFASDNPGLTASDHDLQLTAGPDAAVKVHVGVALGNDADAGYQIMQHVELKTPFRGDTMMSRTGLLLGSRVAGEHGALGYHVDKLTYQRGDDGYKFSLRTLGRICMPGNKANFSFDERFLTTHHYLTREDFESDEAYEPYKAQGAADIYVADFVTGKKERVTRMMPGQFAIFPHFRSDGWLYFMVRDANTKKEYIVASDVALRATRANP
ncbi:MAG: hypothetical protein KC657_37760 [Myxococcales bacterium]|nr:hypothetical protein [Myxococcales bacterium]